MDFDTRQQSHILAFLLASMTVTGCSGNPAMVVADGDESPLDYLSFAKANQKSMERDVPLKYKEAIHNLEVVSERCYSFTVATQEQGLFSSKDKYHQTFTPKVTTIAPGNTLFTLQLKGDKNAETIVKGENRNEPKDGMWLYGVKFKKDGEKTKTVMYYPSFWGESANGVVDAVEGKYEDACPPRRVIHPGLNEMKSELTHDEKY